MSRFRWGIFGTGAISAKFIAGLATARDAEATFVASRSAERAQAFAKGAGVSQAIGGYAEAAKSGGVDAIYIATPPSHHVEHALMCIEAGIPVRVEKPFASSAADAERIAAAALARGVFAMEAMWTRFLPAAQALRDRLKGGVIGTPRLMSGSFGISQVPDPANGIFDAALGGGAVAHLGAYPLSLGQWLFGTPDVVQAMGTIGVGGAEDEATFQLHYPDADVRASCFVSLRAWAHDNFDIMGSEGMIGFRGSIVRPFGIEIANQSPRGADVADFGFKSRLRQNAFVHQVAQRLGRTSRSGAAHESHLYAGNGYHYEADEVRNCIARGAIESGEMPLDDSIAVARTADAITQAIRGRLQA